MFIEGHGNFFKLQIYFSYYLEKEKKLYHIILVLLHINYNNIHYQSRQKVFTQAKIQIPDTEYHVDCVPLFWC